MSVPDWIPEPLLDVGPAALAWWQWLGIVVTIGVSWVVGRAAVRSVLWIGTGVVGRTRTTLDDELLERLGAPLRFLGAIGCTRVLLPVLELHAGATHVAIVILFACFGYALVWGALRLIDLVTSRLALARWAVERPASRSLMTLVGRISKVVVIVIAGIGLLSSMGLPVASLLAGLGIGGIALAFGAQKTVENLFGAVALGIDQPLREGDFVRVEADVLGTVEEVGLRSTRIRTLDRTVVSLPNGRLADMRIETFALRDRCRLSASFGVVYATTAAQLREVLAGFERVLRAHPSIWPDDVIVRFAQFGDSALVIEVMAWFLTGDWGQFRTYRQEVLIDFMDVVERAGTSFAFPTRTLHLVGDWGPAGTPGPAPDARPS
ncbi:MAG: mechanosensitive ion channel family protein [Deltaproteobacteria bacterium]|nr:mechanosensitive ion channel family protein [Deltaproteobacteria bacterium]